MPFYYQSLAEAYYKMGDFRQAYQYMNKAYQANDSVQGEEHSLQISDFMVKYQTKEKELVHVSRLLTIEFEVMTGRLPEKIYLLPAN